MLAKMMRVIPTGAQARTMARRLAIAGLVGCLGLAGCAPTGGASSGGGGGTASVATATPTATAAPTATATAIPQPTTCAQVDGFGGASGLTLANMQLPSGAVAPAPAVSFSGAGQYTLKAYTICAPNNTTDLIVSTGKGPEPFAHLLSFYGWATWNTYPTNGDAQQACSGSCFAFNADNTAKALFSGAPRFLALTHVTPLANKLVTFMLTLAQASDPTCGSNFDSSDTAIYGHAPEYTLYYDLGAGIQWPPMTRLVGNSTPSTIGQDLCSIGTPASIKAFMDHQFSSHGYSSVTCTLNGTDCWKNSSTTVTMNITSASDWMLSVPRPTP